MEEVETKKRKIPHIYFKNKVHPYAAKDKSARGTLEKKKSFDGLMNLDDYTDLESASVYGEKINPG